MILAFQLVLGTLAAYALNATDQTYIAAINSGLRYAGPPRQFGVNLVTLDPGALSSLRHWHRAEDEVVLAQIHKALKPGGTLVLTVPQHPWLWSQADDYAVQQRRYTAAEMHRKLRDAGFSILRSSSFVSLLLPAMALARFRQRKAGPDYDPTQEMRLPAWLNAAMAACMRFELQLIRLGFNWPAGGSRLVVARKIH